VKRRSRVQRCRGRYRGGMCRQILASPTNCQLYQPRCARRPCWPSVGAQPEVRVGAAIWMARCPAGRGVGRGSASIGRQRAPTWPGQRRARERKRGLERRFKRQARVWPLHGPKLARLLAPLAWALTALALVYRLYRLHTRQKYEQQEPVWPPAALRTAPGAQPLHALRARRSTIASRRGEQRGASRQSGVDPSLSPTRTCLSRSEVAFPAMCGEEPTTPRMGVFILVDNTT